MFGSVARAHNFDARSSDADFLVEFDADMPVGLDAVFGTKADLQKLPGRGLGLVQPGDLRKPFVRARINLSRESVDAA